MSVTRWVSVAALVGGLALIVDAWFGDGQFLDLGFCLWCGGLFLGTFASGLAIVEWLLGIGWIRKAIWKRWYPFLTRRLRAQDVCFLNYAYETDPPLGLELDPEDEPNRAGIQLYYQVASMIDLAGKEVLEVSCGHGGGASWVTRTMKPVFYVGLDLNPSGIAFCQERHEVDGLRFLQGDAMRLPFADRSLDAVINVEASHCYPSFAGFLKEVERVLRPGGHFLYTDFRFSEGFEMWERDLESIRWQCIEEMDISNDVLRGMERNAERSLKLIQACLPKILRSIGRDFAGVPNSRIYDALAAGEVRYRRWCFLKK